MKILGNAIRKHFGIALTVLLIGAGLPAVVGTAANAAGYSGSVTVKVHYARSVSAMSDFQQWYMYTFDNGGGTSGNSGSFTQFSDWDSYGGVATITFANATDLTSIGFVVNQGNTWPGSCASPVGGNCKDDASRQGDRSISITSQTGTEVWLRSAAADTAVSISDPLSPASPLVNTYKIHYDGAAPAVYVATRSKIMNASIWNKPQWYKFDGTTAGTSSGTDGFGKWVQFTLSYYTGQVDALNLIVANTDFTNKDGGNAGGSAGNRWIATTGASNATNGEVWLYTGDTTSWSGNAAFATNPYGNAPAITSSPSSGKAGDTLTITGTNLVPTNAIPARTSQPVISIGGTTVTPNPVPTAGSTSVTVTVPAGSGANQVVQLTNGAGSTTAAGGFTYVSAPAISNVNPTSGLRGSSITITGTNLSNATAVTVGGATATPDTNTATTITAKVPAGATLGAGKVSVTTAGGTSNLLDYSVTVAAPTITSISPTAVPVASSFTILGTNLDSVTGITVGGVPATGVTGNTATSVTASMPNGVSAGQQSVIVTTQNGGASAPFALTVLPAAPTITSVAPTSAPRGSTVVVTGTNLTSATFTIGGKSATVLGTPAPNATAASIVVPSDAAFGATTVVASTASGTASSPFSVLGYSNATLKVHYYKADKNYAGLWYHSWIPSGKGSGTVSGSSQACSACGVGGIAGTVSPETAVSASTDSYGGVATITYTGSDIQQVGYLAWSLPGQTKDTGSAVDRFFDFSTSNAGEIWIRNDVTNVYASNPFGNTPSITTVSASSGKAGDTLVINGTNLLAVASPVATSNPSVTIGGINTSVLGTPAPNATAISVTVPNGVPVGSAQDIVLTNAAGTATKTAAYSNVGPEITSLSASSGGRGSTITVTGANLTGATFTVGGKNAVVSPGATSTSATITVASDATFGASNVVATTAGGTASSAYSVTGYTGTVNLTIHYNKQDFGFANTYLHLWLGTPAIGSGTLNVTTVDNQSAERSVSADGVDSYGGVSKIQITGGTDIQQVCYLVWVRSALNTFNKDAGSAANRCHTFTSANNEIWIRNYDNQVGTSDLFAGIQPSPNRSAVQTITFHYDGDTSAYPKLYFGTRSDLNDTVVNPYSYWVNAHYLDFTSPVTINGPTGSSTSKVGTDSYGKFVIYTLPYNAAHSTWVNVIVGNADLSSKDAGQAGTGNRYLTLDASGTTHVYLKTGDTTGNAAFATNPYSAPVVTSLNATSGKSGDVVTATGTNLVANALVAPIVTVGGATATPASSPSPNATSVTFTVPSGLSVGAQAVQITTSGGASNSDKTFTIIGAPTLTSPSPASGIRGDVITLTGAGFINGATSVSFGAVAATSVNVTNATTLTATVPMTAVNGKQDITVSTAGGSATLTGAFTVLHPAPTLLAPTASDINVGQTLNSSTLSGGSATYNGKDVLGTFAWSTPGATPTPGTASYAVTFTPTDGVSYAVATGTAMLTVKDVAPTVTSFSVGGNSVTSALVGSTLVINGTALSTASGVTIGGTNAPIVGSPTATAVTVIVPAETKLGANTVVVTTNGGSANGNIIINAALPTISAITPSTQKQNAAVVVTGTNFTGLQSVKIDGLDAVISVSPSAAPNDTAITVIVPDTASIGTNVVRVTTASGSVDGSITVSEGTPIINNISPLVGLRGTTVSITGKFFTGATATLGGVTLVPTITNATTFTFDVPQEVATGSQPIVLSASGQTLNGTFSVLNLPVITSLSKTSGLRGDTVVINGTDLSSASVTFGGAPATILLTPAPNATTLSITVPSGVASGMVKVVAATAGGVSNGLDYIVLDAPTITKLSATSGQRGSKVTVTGTFLTGATFKVAGVDATVDAGATDTTATITVPNAVAFGATTVEATTVGGTATSAFTVSGYSKATLTVHYNKQDFGFNNTYIHSWVKTGTGSASGVAVPGANSTQSPETSVTSLGTDSYGGVAKVTYTGSNLQAVGYLVWTLSNGAFTKDAGSLSDRFVSFDAPDKEIWIRNYDNAVGSSDLFAGINPSPNRPATQTVKIHYDGDTAKYPKVYLGTRSDLNNPSPNPHAYWVNPFYLDFTTPVTVNGPAGDQTSTIGTDTFGKFVSVAFPYNAAHTTFANMIVGNADLSMKDGTDRFADLDKQGNTEIWLVSGDSAIHGTSTGAFTSNPFTAPVITSLDVVQGKAGDTVKISGTGLKPNANNPSVTIGGINATVLMSPAPNTTAISVTVPSGLTAGVPSAVIVSNQGGTSNADQTFTLVAAPGSITVNPTSGPRGSTVTVTGAGLSGATVTVGGTPAQTANNTESSIDVTVPAGINAGVQQITVTTVGGSLSTAFTVLADQPVLVAPMAGSITFGQTLDKSLLTGGSAKVGGVDVAGKFAFTAPTIAPGVGTANQSVTFTPTDLVNYTSATTTVSVTVTQASPMVGAVPSASPITFGAQLMNATLYGGSASVPGTFAYDLPNSFPVAGKISATVTFTPTDSISYKPVSGITVMVTVNKAKPQVIATPTAAPIIGGQPLGMSTLGSGLANTDGKFTFTNPSVIPPVGTSEQDVTFTPIDASNYESLSGIKASVTVTAPAPVVNGVNPTSGLRGTLITVYGTNFDNATAVTVGGASATFNVNPGGMSITATVPDGAPSGFVSIGVTTPTGNNSRPNAFIVLDPVSIQKIAPLAGPRGTSVTITGSNLSGVAVTIGGTPVVPSASSGTSITFPVPDAVASGPQEVVAKSLMNGSSAKVSFTVLDSPVANLITPTNGLRGDSVTVSGSYLTGASVTVGGVDAVVTEVTDTAVTFTVPELVGSGAQAVSIKTAGGTATQSFTVNDPPSSISLSPTSGLRGTTVTITGQNLTGATTKIGPVDVSAVVTDTTITFDVPANALSGLQKVTVTTVGGSADANFLVLDVPVISDITPTTAKPGDMVFISGSNLAGATVAFAGMNIPAQSSEGAIKFVVPADAKAGSASITVNTNGGTASTQLTVVVAPKIQFFSPMFGTAGTLIMIGGSGLGNASVTFGGVPVTLESNTDLGLSFKAPFDQTPGMKQIVVTTIGGSANAMFNLQSPPVVNDVSPISGLPGTLVTLTGNNLGGATIKFVGMDLKTLSNNDTSVTFNIPDNAPAGQQQLAVVTSGGSTMASFTVVSKPMIKSINPEQGLRGSTTTVNGMGLASGSVLVAGKSAQVLDSRDNMITFIVPMDVPLGKATVQITTPVDQASTSFTVVDTPSLDNVSPSQGLRGSQVTLTGANLNNASVAIGNKLVFPQISSQTVIAFTVPNDVGSGLQVVKVNTPYGSASINFTVLDAPGSLSLNVYQGLRGTSVVASGSNLDNASVVMGGVNVTPDANDSTSVTFKVPNEVMSGPQPIMVNTSGGSSNVMFTVLDTPVISGVNPKAAGRNGNVTVFGQFLNNPQVSIGGIKVMPMNVNGSSFGFTVPAGVSAGTNTISVTTDGGTATTTIEIADSPFISSVNPLTVARGATVSVSGSALSNPTVSIGNIIVTPVNSTATGFQFVMPDSVFSGQQSLNVMTIGGMTSMKISILEGPSLFGVNPTSGVRGSSLSIGGKNLTGASVTIGGIPVNPSQASDSLITFLVPAGVQSGPNQITATVGQNSVSAIFTVVELPPSSITLSPQSGPRGTLVTVSGKNMGGATVSFGSIPVVPVSATDTAITFNVPEAASAGKNVVSMVAQGVTVTAPFVVGETPVITAVSPAAAIRGASITVTGKNFMTGAVNIGGVTVMPIAVTPTSLTVIVPAMAASGAGTLTLTTPGGTASTAFTVIDAPIINTVNPPGASRGATVTLSGNFLSNATVTVGGVPVTPSLNTATTITFTVPINAPNGSAPIVVTTVGGSINRSFAVLADSPVISNINPTSVKAGGAVSITGVGLSNSVITVQGLPASITLNTATTLNFTVPVAAALGNAKITVTNAGGSASTNISVIPFSPVITSLSTNAGKAGSALVITGQNLSNATSVTVAGSSAVIGTNTATSISITLPNVAIGATNVVVTTAGGNDTKAFTVIPDAPGGLALSPTSAVVGATVTVSGSNLDNVSSVTVGGMSAQVTANDSVSATFTVPNVGLGIQTVSVTTSGGIASAKLTVLPPAPTVTSLSADGGKPGDLITINGTNLATVTEVKFNGVATGLNMVGVIKTDTALTVYVPPTTTGTIVVTTANGTATSNSFTIYGAPSVTTVAPVAANRGSVVTLTGTNLGGATTVAIGGTSTSIKSNTDTQIEFTVPVDIAIGASTVVVTTPGGTSVGRAINILQDAPTISSLSATGGKVGDTITINGTNFTNVSDVSFGNVPANLAGALITSTSIQITVPANAKSAAITVTTSGGTATSEVFNVFGTPSVIALSPLSIRRGQVLTITGVNLSGTTGITIGGITVTNYTVVNETTILANVPSGVSLGNQNVLVTTPGGTSLAKQIVVLADLPVITSFQQSISTKRGFGSVTVTGLNLTGVTVKVGNLAATIKPGGTATSLTFILPAMAPASTTATFTLTNGGGTVTSAPTLKITLN